MIALKDAVGIRLVLTHDESKFVELPCDNTGVESQVNSGTLALMEELRSRYLDSRLRKLCVRGVVLKMVGQGSGVWTVTGATDQAG